MISCTLEQVGDRIALVLEKDAVKTLNLRIGETVRLDAGPDGVLRMAGWADDPHARGRAFLRRYHRSFDQLG
jgi:hypothetical protein